MQSTITVSAQTGTNRVINSFLEFGCTSTAQMLKYVTVDSKLSSLFYIRLENATMSEQQQHNSTEYTDRSNHR